jgi:hypothetical protein
VPTLRVVKTKPPGYGRLFVNRGRLCLEVEKLRSPLRAVFLSRLYGRDRSRLGFRFSDFRSGRPGTFISEAVLGRPKAYTLPSSAMTVTTPFTTVGGGSAPPRAGCVSPQLLAGGGTQSVETAIACPDVNHSISYGWRGRRVAGACVVGP